MVNYEDILKAKSDISKHIIKSDLIEIETPLDSKVLLKMESHQKCGSFKVRGALNKILNLTAKEKEAGVVAASAGNHAQGVAIAGTITNTRTVIVMPEAAPKKKVKATEGFGGEVVLHGKVYDDAFNKSKELSENEGLTMAHPFDDPKVIAGQGTIGLEINEDVDNLDAIFIPIGGGGIAAGVSIAIKHKFPKAKIIGVQPKVICSMYDYFHGNKPGDYIKSIADGTSVLIPGKNTKVIIKEMLDDIVVVDEDEIKSTIKYLYEKTGEVAEGAGALALSAILNKKVNFDNFKNIIAIVSGKNIDTEILDEIIK